MTKVVVEAGICGFSTTIEVVKLSSQKVKITFSSDCEMINKLGQQLEELDWQNLYHQQWDSSIYGLFQCVRHVTCPIPLAILKAVEVETGVALPKDVIIRFIR